MLYVMLSPEHHRYTEYTDQLSSVKSWHAKLKRISGMSCFAMTVEMFNMSYNDYFNDNLHNFTLWWSIQADFMLICLTLCCVFSSLNFSLVIKLPISREVEHTMPVKKPIISLSTFGNISLNRWWFVTVPIRNAIVPKECPLHRV